MTGPPRKRTRKRTSTQCRRLLNSCLPAPLNRTPLSLQLVRGEGPRRLQHLSDVARPWALALRTGSRIVCAEDLLADVGLAVPEEQEEEVEKFREFLDQVSPEDFESGS